MTSPTLQTLPPPLLYQLIAQQQPPGSTSPYGPGTISFVGSDVNGGNTDPITVTWPAGLAPDDVALVFWTFQSPATPTTPSGFTLTTFNAGTTGTMLTYVYQKVLTGSESGTLTLTSNFGVNRQSACLVVYRGCDPTTPVDGTPAVDTTGVSQPLHNNPPYTPTVPNCVIVVAIHERASSVDTDFQEPTGYLKRATTDHGPAWGSGGTVTAVADDGLAAGRDTSTVTPPDWRGDGSTQNIVTYTLALRPITIAATGAADTITHPATSSDTQKKALGAGSPVAHTATQGTTRKQAAASGTSSAHVATASTGVASSGASGSGASSTHATTQATGRKQATVAAASPAHATTGGTSRKQATSTGVATTHPTVADTGKATHLGTGLPSPHATTAATGKAALSGVGRPTVHPLTATVSGKASAAGASVVQRVHVLSTGLVVPAYDPAFHGIDGSTTGTGLDNTTSTSPGLDGSTTAGSVMA